MPAAPLLATASASRPRLAIVDMTVAGDSPAGSCVRAEIVGLMRHWDITVFTERCDLPELPGLEIVRVAAPRRPVLLRYLCFHLSMPWAYAAWRARGGQAALLQATQGQLPGADIAYAHFCHAAYLGGAWQLSGATGLRRAARWLTHRLNAVFEARAFARARVIVVPSQGLRRELGRHHPHHADKIRVLANPVDVARFARPGDFDRRAARAALGMDMSTLVIAFMALGDFARKGLGVLIEALAGVPAERRSDVRLLVIGGRPGEIADFDALAQRHGVTGQIHFAGMQQDVRPFLWMADAFAFPSAYEIFSLAILQAAAAGLPVLVSRGLYGAEEFVVDGRNGWVVARERAALSQWFAQVSARRETLAPMGRAAFASVQRYDEEAFRAQWVELVDGLLRAR